MAFILPLYCLIYLRQTCLFTPVTLRICKSWFIIFTLYVTVPTWRCIARLSTQEIVGLHPALTSTVLRKHYYHQNIIRAQAQLSKRPVPTHPEKIIKLSFCHEQVELDILMVSTPTSSIPRAYGGLLSRRLDR